MNTHTSKLRGRAIVALADPQQGQRRQQSVDEAADVPDRAPAPHQPRPFVEHQRRDGGDQDGEQHRRLALPRAAPCAMRMMPGEAADEELVHRPPKRAGCAPRTPAVHRRTPLVEVRPQQCRGTAVRRRRPATAGNWTAAPRRRSGSAGRAPAGRWSAARRRSRLRRSLPARISPAATSAASFRAAAAISAREP